VEISESGKGIYCGRTGYYYRLESYSASSTSETSYLN